MTQVLPAISHSPGHVPVRSVSGMFDGVGRQADPELFFPIAIFPIATVNCAADRQVEAARAVCAPCGVRAKCLSYALEVMPEGIWGGTTHEERLAARRRQLRRQADAQSSEMAGAQS
jgi:hypothetical protein